MDSQNVLKYMQLLHTNYNDMASSSSSLGIPSSRQYPPEASVYSNEHQYTSPTSSYGYNNTSLYGCYHHPQTGQYFSTDAVATSNDYYNYSPLYGYSSSSAYNYAGDDNTSAARIANMKANCSAVSSDNIMNAQRSRSIYSKRNLVAQRSTNVDTVVQSATYLGTTTQSATYLGTTTQSAISSAATVQSAISPEMSHGNLTQTTPITSLFGSGDSLLASSSVPYIAYSDSLKKRSVDTENICEVKQTRTRQSAKRNLKYSPVSDNDWCRQTARGASGCVSDTKVDLCNNKHYHNTLSLLEYGGGKRFDPLKSATHNSKAMKYESPIGSSIHNKCKDGYDQFRLRETCSMLHPTREKAAYGDNVTYLDNYDCESTLVIDLNITPEEAENNAEHIQETKGDPEDEEILVGGPIRFEDYLEQLQITSMDFKTEDIVERRPMICKGCFHKTSNRKTPTKSSEILNRLLRDNSTPKTSKTGEKSNLITHKDTINKQRTDPVKCGGVEKDAVSKKDKSSQDEAKANADDITGRLPLADAGCSHEEPQWIELSIEVAEDLNHSGHLCFGCQKPVFDRYVIQVKDHGFWHADCLKCSNCQDNLSDQKSCYVKNEQVFCRNDYNILFGLSCVKCSLQFKREQDWMRVAGQHRYHIACFLCKICKRQLGNNEKYHLVNGTDIYCTNHYRDMVNGESSDGQQPPKKAKRNRTSYTEAQIKFLQDRFLRDSNPDGNELEKIATHINLKKRVVQVWFQNNRARLKKSANNSKNGNQENKNPINNGVAGNSALNDAMSIDWDNSLEQSSLDEHTYPNSASPSQMRPGSTHFMDTAYSLTPALSGPLLCLPSSGVASATMGQESGSLGDGSGSGTSTCGTPRDQVSPHFSDLSSTAYQGNENTVTGPVGGNDNNVEDVPGNGGSDCTGGNNSVVGCGNKGAASPSVILSALRNSVVRDKFSEGCQRRMDLQEQDMRHHMMLFQDPSLRQHHHFHQQPYHSDLMYGPHMGIYGNLYNMYNSYGHLSSLGGDQNSELPDSHQSFLRMKTDQTQNSVHQITDQPFDCHYNDSHIFGRGHHDVSSGFGSARASFGDTNCHTASTGNTGSSGNSSPLSFLGTPSSQLHARSSSGPCSFIQGHQISSPVACGQGHSYARQACGSPGLIGGSNGGSMGRSGNSYFTENENA